MLIARAVTAVGLALLLVVGAWSTSRGSADVHVTPCLAAGVAAPADATGAADATTIDVLASTVGVCLLAVLGGVALVLLFRRLTGHDARPLGARTPRRVSPSRAGPVARPRTLTLIQLSISRT